MTKRSPLESRFLTLWTNQWGCLIILESEKMIVPGRKFRFDFVHFKTKTAIEIQGGTYCRKSRHSSPTGLDRDYTKINLAIINNWKVFQLSTVMVTKDWINAIGNYILEQK